MPLAGLPCSVIEEIPHEKAVQTPVVVLSMTLYAEQEGAVFPLDQ